MRKRSIPFADRIEAGEALAKALSAYQRAPSTIVLGLCRGGIPVARIVALRLQLPLEALLVRKLGTPANPELAMGAIAEGGTEVLNRDVLRWVESPELALTEARARELAELQRRADLLRSGKPQASLAHQQVLLVDDGAATGATMRAAIQSMRKAGASRIVVALPVAPPETMRELGALADETCCVWENPLLQSVGSCYRSFPQVSDWEVRTLLREASLQAAKSATPVAAPPPPAAAALPPKK